MRRSGYGCQKCCALFKVKLDELLIFYFHRIASLALFFPYLMTYRSIATSLTSALFGQGKGNFHCVVHPIQKMVMAQPTIAKIKLPSPFGMKKWAVPL